MDKSGMLSCPLGLYKIHWSEGGTSLASVGNLYNGDRWIACTNWTSPKSEGIVVKLKNYINQIEALELLADNKGRNDD